MKEVLFGKTLTELQELCRRLCWPEFRARQMYQAMYARGCNPFEEWTVLSRAEREYLGQNFDLACYEALKLQTAGDGTIKFLYPLAEYFSADHASAEARRKLGLGQSELIPAVETVLIPNPKPGHKGEYTLCVSSQWGCRWACQFCQTGEMGLKRQLSCAEILAQLRCARLLLEGQSAKTQTAKHVNRIVFMGMGEPLENPHLERALEILSDEGKRGGYGLSARRITVSTVGLVEYLELFFQFAKPYRLALSVHNPLSEERSRLIPAEFVSPLEDVIRLMEQRQSLGDKRRITFEYTLIAGENDQDYHAEALADLALRVGARVNLIPCHENSAGYLGSSAADLHRFQTWMSQRGLRCTIRKSQGEEIQAACGMLAGSNDPAEIDPVPAI
ncbi:23S rRNA (adenine(2503)-C(2))-methyltransferase RlmN [Candidatus Haliotispira prima]|uniref:23S rRNA (Adenine(2503)-C(2))-methyltransferase RlmN n=1 Tax=Candidatus Haliotispira prima TaxID=3034016 RepID=A0ABY8MFB6_9SPIO|nr:23S rRNA (adenine(2503)-C(2))-methyltransferase RlmN [Candidatus Haliotispira prima]